MLEYIYICTEYNLLLCMDLHAYNNNIYICVCVCVCGV